jgi:hypothetical protein
MTQRWTLVLLAVCSWSAGCGSVEPPTTAPSPSPAPVASPQTPDQEEQKQVALAARDAMAGQLMGKLMETLGSAGPAAAIGVCRQEAPQIAADTGKKFGVAIGRTSFRLRNAKNAPPAWADPLVAAQPADPQFVPLPDGQLGALLPIRLKPECMLCHGPKDQILTEVREALATHYPDDQATGFQTGDLRGWFWVTVPAGARLPGTNSPTSANAES